MQSDSSDTIIASPPPPLRTDGNRHLRDVIDASAPHQSHELERSSTDALF